MKQGSYAVLAAMLAVGSVASVAGAAQEFGDNPACTALAKLAAPAADQPDAAARERLKDCDSESLYYADGGKPDFVQARLCAFVERDKGNELVFGGSGVLMMIYANGEGVARNIDLARKFACETEGAPAELDGRLEHLDAMAKAGAKADRMDLCDDITSGYMMGFCADRGASAAKVERDRRVAALTAKWTAAERAALARLRVAADAYFEAAVDGEVDMSGSARGAMAVGAQEDLEKGFADAIDAFEHGRFPTGDAATLAAADKALNASYAAAMRYYKQQVAEGLAGTITTEGIRDAERAWIKYRDAWVAFGAQKYPAVGADAWRTYFTQERERALKALAGE